MLLLYQMFIIPANNMVNDEIHDCEKCSDRSYKCITLLDLHRHLQNKTQQAFTKQDTTKLFKISNSLRST